MMLYCTVLEYCTNYKLGVQYDIECIVDWRKCGEPIVLNLVQLYCTGPAQDQIPSVAGCWKTVKL